MNRLLITLSPLLLFLASCATNFSGNNGIARDRELQRQGYMPVNLNSYSGDTRYWSNVKVAGAEVKLLIDSGANSTDVDKLSADNIGLKQNTDYEVVSKGALGREVRSKLGVTTFKIGSQYIDPFVIVINEGQKKGSSVGKYNGQIGLDAMIESGVVIDLFNEQLWMPKKDIPGDNQFPRLGNNHQLGHEALPLYASHKYSHLILEGSSNGRPVSWIVDTGAEVSVIDSSSARNLGMDVVQTSSRMIDISGDTSKLGYTLATNLGFGKTRINSLPLAVTDLSNVKRSFKLPNGRSVDGILGVDFLKASKALIDPRSKLIHLGYAENRGANTENSHVVN